jgi:hypothetical protein
MELEGKTILVVCEPWELPIFWHAMMRDVLMLGPAEGFQVLIARTRDQENFVLRH